MGADVTLVLGPTNAPFDLEGMSVIRVTSADEMHKACLAAFEKAAYAILTAAVADFKPKSTSTEKIKKGAASMQLDLVPTVDVLADLGSKKTAVQVLVGFALETNDELSNAREKLSRKNLDFIVLNSLRDAGAGFGHDTNKVTVISRAGAQMDCTLMSKTDVAHEIWKIILDQTHA
jgi:phosphopantothenoylcysteine decarboxylase/phosphopantothenate--cysteine ligase